MNRTPGTISTPLSDFDLFANSPFMEGAVGADGAVLENHSAFAAVNPVAVPPKASPNGSTPIPPGAGSDP